MCTTRLYTIQTGEWYGREETGVDGKYNGAEFLWLDTFQSPTSAENIHEPHPSFNHQ